MQVCGCMRKMAPTAELVAESPMWLFWQCALLYTTKFSLAKIFAKCSYYVLGQIFTLFNFANRVSYFPGSCGWSS